MVLVARHRRHSRVHPKRLRRIRILIQQPAAQKVAHSRRARPGVEGRLSRWIRRVRIRTEVVVERNILIKNHDHVLDRRGRCTATVLPGHKTAWHDQDQIGSEGNRCQLAKILMHHELSLNFRKSESDTAWPEGDAQEHTTLVKPFGIRRALQRDTRYLLLQYDNSIKAPSEQYRYFNFGILTARENESKRRPIPPPTESLPRVP